MVAYIKEAIKLSWYVRKENPGLHGPDRNGRSTLGWRWAVWVSLKYVGGKAIAHTKPKSLAYVYSLLWNFCIYI